MRAFKLDGREWNNCRVSHGWHLRRLDAAGGLGALCIDRSTPQRKRLNGASIALVDFLLDIRVDFGLDIGVLLQISSALCARHIGRDTRAQTNATRSISSDAASTVVGDNRRPPLELAGRHRAHRWIARYIALLCDFAGSIQYRWR